MIVLVRPDASAEEIAALVQAVAERGLDTRPLDAHKGGAFEVLGGDRGRVLGLAEHPAVAGILTRRLAVRGGEPFWPHVALQVSILGLLLLAAVVLLAAFLPVGLSDPPGVPVSEADAATEWYLRPLASVYTVLGEGHTRAGGIIVLVFWLLLFLVPFLDRGDSTTGRRWVRRLWQVVGALVLVWVVVTTSGVWP